MNKKIVSLLAVLFLSVVAGYAWEKSKAATVVAPITSQDYAAGDSETIYVMLAGFDECNPCKIAEKLVWGPLTDFYAKDEHVKVVKLDVVKDKGTTPVEKQLATLFQLQKYPTMLVIYHQDVFWKKEGFSSAQKDQVLSDVKEAVQKLK